MDSELSKACADTASRIARVLNLSNADAFRVQEILLCAFGPLFAKGGPLNAEGWTLDELLEKLTAWKNLASGKTCVSFENLCYGASSLWHQTHRENFRKVDRKPDSLSKWVLNHEGHVDDDFPAQVLAILTRLQENAARRV